MHRETGPVFWITHSFGGFILARAVSEYLDQDEIQGLVFISSQCEKGLSALTTPKNLLIKGLPTGLGKFPARLLKLGSADEPPAAIADACYWTTSAQKKPGFMSSFSKIKVPWLTIVGAADTMHSPEGCEIFVSRLGSKNKKFNIIGTGTGYSKDYGHSDIVLDKTARNEVWPILTDWISKNLETNSRAVY